MFAAGFIARAFLERDVREAFGDLAHVTWSTIVDIGKKP